jgi:MazG family protein
VKLALSDDEGVELPRPVLLHHLGLEDEMVVAVDWWELDRTVEPDHLTSLYIPAFVPGGGAAAAGEEVAALVALMETLRERCPWDSVQTHASLMPHLVEESYEVLDALDALAGGAGEADTPVDTDAYAHLQEELGDLLFQIVFHACLADEEGQFNLADVARGVHDKLVHRHPHVFGDVDADTAEQVVTNWEAIKKTEKGRRSVTEGIPAGLPALMLTAKLARKARAVGLEPDEALDLPAAVTLAALTQRAAGSDPKSDDPLAGDGGDVQAAVGELLFTVANLSQRLGIDAEQALRQRALTLRADILRAEGVPEDQVGNR